MKAFLVGFLTVCAVGVLGVISFLLTPLFLMFAFVLRVIISAIFFLFAIWLLGKMVIFIWNLVFKKKQGVVYAKQEKGNNL